MRARAKIETNYLLWIGFLQAIRNYSPRTPIEV
jgi:hypothetical protein